MKACGGDLMEFIHNKDLVFSFELIDINDTSDGGRVRFYVTFGAIHGHLYCNELGISSTMSLFLPAIMMRERFWKPCHCGGYSSVISIDSENWHIV